MSGSQDPSVKEFCQELQSILDSRPPISKAKMMSITKAALKAIKFYKHIVMNVEKFITKCKPEYKIPGLYVIDSIVRQSRHQYGMEKDVYGSRFAKNILATLHHVNKCPADDRNKITRVLNLWEKNAIFSSDLIRQLFEVHQSDGNTDLLSAKVALPDDKSSGETSSGGKELDRFRELQETLLRASAKGDPDTTSILTEIQQITNQLLESQKKSATGSNSGDEPSSTTTSIINPIEPMQSSVANVLDDFDYGSDNDDDEPRRPTTSTFPTSFPTQSAPPPLHFLPPPPGLMINPLHANPMPFPMMDGNNLPMPMSFDPTHPPPIFFQQQLPPPLSAPQQQQQQQQPPLNFDNNRPIIRQSNDVDLRPEDMDSDNTNDHRHHRHSRGGSPHSRFHFNRRRSRSPSPARESKRGRSSPNSMDRRGSATTRLKEVEKRERRRKGLPPLKEDHLVVSSRTLWLGHLPKIISEIDLRETLEPHGEISDINTIPPRGCAFVCFKERSDASRCLEKMKDFRFHGNQVKIAWAMSKGVKDRFKDYWDAEHGCTYIPYAELKDISNFSALAEGGTIDDESTPASLKAVAPAPVQQEPPPVVHQQPVQPLIQMQPPFQRPEFQPPPQALPQAPAPVQLEPANRLPPGSTILMAPHHESPIHVGVPLQMVPPGAQIIQVQQHPHGQPVQVMQRITGHMFPNSQIVHQMPYGHVIRNAQPGAMIQLQHHPAELKELNAQQAFAPGGGLHLLAHANSIPAHHHLMGPTPVGAGVPLAAGNATGTFAHTVEGPSLIKFHEDPHQRAVPAHLEEHQRRPMSMTDESLLRLSASSAASSASTHFSAHPPAMAPPLLGRSASPLATHQHPQSFGNNPMPGQPQAHPPLLPLPVSQDEHPKPSPVPRRISRFQDRDPPTQPPDSSVNYAAYRGGRANFSDRPNLSAIPRDPMRGRGGVMVGGRGFNSNHSPLNDRNLRPELMDNNIAGFRGRGGFIHGGRGNGGANMGGDFRFSTHGNPRS